MTPVLEEQELRRRSRWWWFCGLGGRRRRVPAKRRELSVRPVYLPPFRRSISWASDDDRCLFLLEKLVIKQFVSILVLSTVGPTRD